jgi:hypothetical protein
MRIIANPGTVFVPGREPIVLAPPPSPRPPPVAVVAYEPVRAVPAPRREPSLITSIGTVEIPGRAPMVLEKPVFELPLALPLAAAPAAPPPPAGLLPSLTVGIVGGPGVNLSAVPANLYVNPETDITEFVIIDLDAGVY